MSRKSTYNKSSLNYYKVVFVKCKSNLAPDIFLTFSKSTPHCPFSEVKPQQNTESPLGSHLSPLLHPHLLPGQMAHPTLQSHGLYLLALGFDLTQLPTEKLGCILPLPDLPLPLHSCIVLREQSVTALSRTCCD